MAYELKDGQWSLFRNERKSEPKHADFTGTLKIGGVEYYLNAWTKEANGKKFFSGSLKAKSGASQAADLDTPF